MRAHGHLSAAAGLGPGDHVCWSYDDDRSLHDAATAYMEDGLSQGARVMYLGGGPLELLRERVLELPGAEQLLRRGAIEVYEHEQLYDLSGPIDARSQLAIYDGAVRRALGEGYTGLRVFAEVSPLVELPDRWASHVRFEHLADRFIANSPVSVLCAFDRRRVPEAIMADLCRTHPASHGPDELAPFRIYATGEGLALEGAVDLFAARDLARLLELTTGQDEEVVLDVSGLTFADHHAVMALAAHQRRREARGATVAVRAPSYPVARLCELLGVTLS